ncbi:hypothetical protein CKO42_16370 [Lamprobacter modestohalophilus]|uniref:Uncharacterized protein n=1 Tax=Lamprobacter modestohalophilus TaxID=1064514 RepID=A0A9X0WAM8_9GAMM|nr:plasmid partition protein ParG [Lamprobacter modestohalophilus]MBK1619986.1 hypothetical protein [Lamprobacter modestohalophilus]
MNTQPETRARANLPIDRELHRRFKAACAMRGLPMSAVAAAAIEQELTRLDRLIPRRRDSESA